MLIFRDLPKFPGSSFSKIARIKNSSWGPGGGKKRGGGGKRKKRGQGQRGEERGKKRKRRGQLISKRFNSPVIFVQI